MNSKSLSIFDEVERAKSELTAYEVNQAKLRSPFNPVAKKKELESLLKSKKEEEDKARKVMKAAEVLGARSHKTMIEILQNLVAEIRRAKLSSVCWQDVVPMKRLPTGEDVPLIRMEKRIASRRNVSEFGSNVNQEQSFHVDERIEAQHFSAFKIPQLLANGWEISPPDQDISLPVLDQSNSFPVPVESLPDIFGEVSGLILRINNVVLEAWAEDPSQKEVEEFKKSAK